MAVILFGPRGLLSMKRLYNNLYITLLVVNYGISNTIVLEIP